MASETQIALFRDYVGDTGENPAFDTPEINVLFDGIATSYPSASDDEAMARAVLRGILILRANAAKLVTYKQNQSSENASDISKQLQSLYETWQDILAAEIGNGSSLASWGTLAGGFPKRPLPREWDYSDTRRRW